MPQVNNLEAITAVILGQQLGLTKDEVMAVVNELNQLKKQAI